MAHAEGIDEALERNLAPGRDRAEQVAHRELAEALLLLELDLGVARFEGENVGGLLDPALLEKELDLLLAQALDVEGAAGDEMLEVLDLLIRAGELSGATRDRALLAGRRGIAHDRRVQVAGTAERKPVGLGAAWPLLQSDFEHLRDHVARALDRHRIADAHIEPRDLVRVVERRVRHHYAADGDRLELGDRGERAGAADLDVDRLDDGGRL